jgi:valyl-tRNA synthetase
MEAMAKDGLEVVKRDGVKFVPEHWTATYNHWLENIQDWCISRQLWWGHQIPAWYDQEGQVFVGRDRSAAEEVVRTLRGKGYPVRAEGVREGASASLFKVRVGGFPTKEAADAAADRLHKDGQSSTWVVKAGS